MKTLYDEIVEAGIAIDKHESDLYIVDCPKAREILARYPRQERIARGFRSTLDGNLWIDVPFAFEPWWKARRGVTK